MLRDAEPNRLEDLIALNAMFRPGPDGEHPELLRAQARPRGGALSASAARDGARRDLRDHGLPGAGDAGRRRSWAATRSAAPTCCAARWARRSPRRWPTHREIFREGAAKKAISAEVGRRGLRPDGEVRGLRLQQVARRRVLAAGVSHRLAQGPLHGRVLLRQHDGRDGQHRQAEGAVRRRQDLRRDVRDARRQRAARTASSRWPPTSVRYGLGAVKGTGQGAIEAIVAAREEGGPFTSLFDFCARVDRGRINSRVVEALIKAGAFDRMQPGALVAAREHRPRARLGRDAGGARRPGRPVRPSSTTATRTARAAGAAAGRRARPWSIKERLTLEKSALGFYLSGHLFDQSARRGAPLRQARASPT